MTDFDQTSLRDELEARIIALLTGELSETEADQLEKILANDAELSAFRDRMAELMGELHQASDELSPAEGEPPRRLSDERRAKIFGDPSVLEAKAKKKIWMNPALWGVAASIAMVFFISALSTVKLVQSVRHSEQVFEAMPIVPPPQKEPAYTVNMQQRNRSTPAPRPPAITVNNPSDLDIPTLNIDVNEDSSSTYGRGGGGFGGGLSGIREMSVSSDELIDAVAKRDQTSSDDFSIDQVETAWLFDHDRTIPVDIPGELIEGTPEAIRVPNLERKLTEAPRMVVRPSSEIAETEELDLGIDYRSRVGNRAIAYDESGFTVDAKRDVATKEKAKNNVAPGSNYESNLRFSGVSGGAANAPVDAFAAPTDASVISRTEADKRGFRKDGYASSGPVDPFAAPVAKKERQAISGLADLEGRELDAIKELNGKITSSGEIEFQDSIDANYSNVDGFASESVAKPKGQVFYERKSEVAKLLKDKDGELSRSQTTAGDTAIEKMASARAAKVRQTPKQEKLAAEDPFSTFSLNISDVSFKLAQAALQNSRVPPAAQIRTEEFVNSFDYGDPSPRSNEPVALHWEMAQHPFEHDRQVVRFSLQTQASGRTSGQALNISLLVDNSGSMQRPDRQAILQNSLQTLEQKLTPQDNLNIILFARQPRLIAEAQTRASQKAAVETALAYRPEGGTNLEAGLHAAYESARRNFVSSGSNRVILMTDGAANLGNVNAGDLAEYVVEQRKQGIALDAYGIGWDDYNDALLEEITRNGDGRYAFLNSVEDASDDFSEKLAGTLRVAASNVKVQIEWNPDRVQRYRQIGYDLHQLKKEDFRDNTVDAAEIGEAESGTALYVMKIDHDPEIIGGLGTLHVRYLDPASGLYKEYSWPLPMPRQVNTANAASPSMRLAMSSAFFGERLAASPYAGGYNFNDLHTMTSGLPEAFPKQPRVKKMQSMLLQASELYGENK